MEKQFKSTQQCRTKLGLRSATQFNVAQRAVLPNEGPFLFLFRCSRTREGIYDGENHGRIFMTDGVWKDYFMTGWNVEEGFL